MPSRHIVIDYSAHEGTHLWQNKQSPQVNFPLRASIKKTLSAQQTWYAIYGCKYDPLGGLYPPRDPPDGKPLVLGKSQSAINWRKDDRAGHLFLAHRDNMGQPPNIRNTQYVMNWRSYV
jgi:hypothetical protein